MKDRKEFLLECSAKLEKVEKILKRHFPSKVSPYEQVLEAMEYSFFAGGKRIRSFLMFEVFQMFEGRGEAIEYFMTAIEMIHTYSLIHDDLPAMDNDDYRRGRLTNHKVYGEDMAILAGDGLLNGAYEMVAKAFSLPNVDATRLSKAFSVLGQKSGVFGMIGGQAIDIKNSGRSLVLSELEEIYRLKTAALLEASLMIGGILADCREEEVRGLEKIANKIGMAFQIQDDILDCTGTFEETGKSLHSDEKNQKRTYLDFFGLEEAGIEVERLSKEGISLLEGFPVSSDFLKEFLLYLIHRKK